MGAQSFPNLTTPGTTSTVTMSTSSVTSSSNVATATTVLSVGQSLSNTLTTSLTSTSSESDTGQEAEYSLYGKLQYKILRYLYGDVFITFFFWSVLHFLLEKDYSLINMAALYVMRKFKVI